MLLFVGLGDAIMVPFGEELVPFVDTLLAPSIVPFIYFYRIYLPFVPKLHVTLLRSCLPWHSLKVNFNSDYDVKQHSWLDV